MEGDSSQDHKAERVKFNDASHRRQSGFKFMVGKEATQDIERTWIDLRGEKEGGEEASESLKSGGIIPGSNLEPQEKGRAKGGNGNREKGKRRKEEKKGKGEKGQKRPNNSIVARPQFVLV